MLEQEAEEQRRRLHETVTELRSQVNSTVRNKLDIMHHVREHPGPISAAVFLVTLLFGYGTAGTIKHMVR
jgi:hypothetical protein